MDLPFEPATPEHPVDVGAPALTAPPPPPSGDPTSGGIPAPPAGMPLRRRPSRRMLGGVCAGLAERLDLDVSLIRVAFVVLAFVWGLGIVVYVAMWALVPRAGDDAEHGEVERPAGSWLAFLLLGAVLVLGVLALASWWGGPRWGGGVGLLWAAVVVGVLVVALRRPGKPTSVRRILGAVVLSGLTLVVLVVGGFLALVASTGVPMTGGIGERVYVPTSLAQVQRTYATAIGSMTVDLRHVHFGTATVHVTASVAVGQLIVEVPAGVVVDVNAHSGYGNVVSSPGSLTSFAVQPGAHAQLVLTAEAGVGQVDLVRSGSAATRG